MKKVMGFWRGWGLIVGMMIGSGIFMLPTVLAPYGTMSFLGWLISGLGTLFIALMLSLLAKRKALTGGPYAYTREGLGDLAGFIIGWGYWVAIIAAIAASSVAITGYMGYFFPLLSENPKAGALTALLCIWICCGINLSGVKNASIFQLITTLLKILPLFLLAVLGLFWGDSALVIAQETPQQDLLTDISTMVLLTMWAFIGVECVTVPADDMIEPEKNIPRALIIGTLTVTLIYLLITYAVMALLPHATLLTSTAPLSDATSTFLGTAGASIIAVGAIISIFSSVNVNVLVGGVMPQAMAEDNLFPKYFSRLNKGGAPGISILFSSAVASILVLMNYTQGLIGAFKILILLSTLATILPYITSAIAEMVMQKKDRVKGIRTPITSWFVVIGALVFSLFAVVGSGGDVIIQGSLLLLAGLPFYFYETRKNRNKKYFGDLSL